MHPTILTGSPLACVDFDLKNEKNIRVYFQDVDLNIIELQYRDNKWQLSRNPVGRAKLNSGIAAIACDEGREIRVYFLDEHSKIVERRQSTHDDKWHNGDLTGHFQAARYSKLGAVTLKCNQKREARLYYQDNHDKIQELMYRENKWERGSDRLPKAFPGTRLGVTSHNEQSMLWLFLQLPDLTFKEMIYSGHRNWEEGNFKSDRNYAPQAPITAAASSSREVKLRVMTIDEQGTLCVTPFDGSRWGQTKKVEAETLNYSDVVMTSIAGGRFPENAMRAFFQFKGRDVAELATKDGNSWELESKNLIPSS